MTTTGSISNVRLEGARYVSMAVILMYELNLNRVDRGRQRESAVARDELGFGSAPRFSEFPLSNVPPPTTTWTCFSQGPLSHLGQLAEDRSRKHMRIWFKSESLRPPLSSSSTSATCWIYFFETFLFLSLGFVASSTTYKSKLTLHLRP